ncbi:MAG: cation transporter [Pseudomonadales bacterium]
MVGCTDCAAGQAEAGLEDPRFRGVLWVALVLNFSMFLVELYASRLGDSMSLQADALDFFGDAANYGISLFVVGMALAVRARAAIFKSVTMAMFGTWVIASALYRAVVGSSPEPMTMSVIALLALVVNVGVAALLYQFRTGDSNRQSIWLCSRNDAIGNLAVMLAAAGVFLSDSRWPDLLVAAIIAALNISAAVRVLGLARVELQVARERGDQHSHTPAQSRLS